MEEMQNIEEDQESQAETLNQQDERIILDNSEILLNRYTRKQQ